MVVQLRTQRHWSAHDQFANVGTGPAATGTANDATVSISGSTLWPATIAAVGTRGTITAPGASGTGWTKSGSVISTTAASARLTSLDMTGIGLRVSHNDCIATDCKITGSVTVRNVQIWDTGTNCQLVHCEIGQSGFTAIGAESGQGDVGTGLLVDHCLIQGNLENGINPGATCTIQDSVIRHLGVSGAPHYDCIECFGGETSLTIARCVVFVNSDGAGTIVGALDTWIADTGAVNLTGNIDDCCVIDSLVGGGSSCFNFDDANGSPGVTNVRVGKNRAGASHPCYYIRNSATNVFRDDTNLTIAGWELYYAEDDMSNGDTFNPTLTTSSIAGP